MTEDLVHDLLEQLHIEGVDGNELLTNLQEQLDELNLHCLPPHLSLTSKQVRLRKRKTLTNISLKGTRWKETWLKKMPKRRVQ